MLNDIDQYICPCESAIALSLGMDTPVRITHVIQKHLGDFVRLLSRWPELENGLLDPGVLVSFLERIHPVLNPYGAPTQTQPPQPHTHMAKFAVTPFFALVGAGTSPRNARCAALWHAILVLASARFQPHLPPLLVERVAQLHLPAARPRLAPPPLQPDAHDVPTTGRRFHVAALHKFHAPQLDLLAHHLKLNEPAHQVSPFVLLAKLGVDRPWFAVTRATTTAGVNEDDRTWIVTAQSSMYRCLGEGPTFFDALRAAAFHVVCLAVCGRAASLWPRILEGKAMAQPLPNFRQLPVARAAQTHDNRVMFMFVPVTHSNLTTFASFQLSAPAAPLTVNPTFAPPTFAPPTLPPPHLTATTATAAGAQEPLTEHIIRPIRLCHYTSAVLPASQNPLFSDRIFVARILQCLDPATQLRICAHPLFFTWLRDPLIAACAHIGSLCHLAVCEHATVSFTKVPDHVERWCARIHIPSGGSSTAPTAAVAAPDATNNQMVFTASAADFLDAVRRVGAAVLLGLVAVGQV